MNRIIYSLASFLLLTSSYVFAGLPTYELPNNEWRMISLPLTPPTGEDSVAALFGDDLGKDAYPDNWVVYQYDVTNNQYGEHLKLNDKLESGKGYWIIQETGVIKTLTMPSNSYYTKPNPFQISLANPQGGAKYQWNMAGLPFNSILPFNELEFSDGIHKRLWRYNKNGYEIVEAGDQLNAWDGFWVATSDQAAGDKTITVKTFGTKGIYDVTTWEHPDGITALYRPTGLTKRPVIFYAPGYGTEGGLNDNSSSCKTKYSTLLSFIASHGYAVICNAKGNSVGNRKDKPEGDGKGTQNIIDHFVNTVNHPNIAPLVDLKKIGILGFSSGGGHAFKVLNALDGKDWGTDARFLFVMEQWFAFSMNNADMNALEKTNIVFLQFGKDGNNVYPFNEKSVGQDPRILLTQYELLTGINAAHKDYQIFSDANHAYPYGKDINSLQGILRPLDALMQYTFKGNEKAKKAALEVGTDSPYEDGYQKLYEKDAQPQYHFSCDHSYWAPNTFDHCGNYEANLP
jgi:hypothetical protein